MAHRSFLLEVSLPCDNKGTLEKSLLLFPDNQLQERGGLSQNSQEAFFTLVKMVMLRLRRRFCEYRACFPSLQTPAQLQSPWKKVSVVVQASNPSALEEWRQEDAWGSLASQLGLMVSASPNERFSLRSKG